MAYLSGFTHDIFFSYAHGPESNVSVAPERVRYLQRWTQELADNIMQSVNFYLSQKDASSSDASSSVAGWIDRSLNRAQVLDEALREKASNAALFVCIMSSYYLRSKYCLQELEWFKDTYADEGGNQRRTFVVRIMRTDRDQWPRALKSSSGSTVDGYKFYENIEVDQPFFDPFGWPVPQPTDEPYWKAVRGLSLDLAKRLWELKQGQTAQNSNGLPIGHGSGVARNSQKIFLGLMHDTLQQTRNEIRSSLTEQGFEVTPTPAGDPFDQTSLDATLHSLVDCQAAVLVANEYCGRWPPNERGGFISHQMDRLRERNIPVHLWVKVDDFERSQTPEYREYLQQLSIADGMRFSNPAEFCQSLAQLRSSVSDLGLAVLVSNRPSEAKPYTDFQEAVASAISESGRLILTSNLSAGANSIRLSDFDGSLRDADTLAIVCFDQRWTWASQLMAQLRQLRGGKNARRCQLLVTGPIAKEPLTLDARTLSFDSIDGSGIDLSALKKKITQMLSAPRALQ